MMRGMPDTKAGHRIEECHWGEFVVEEFNKLQQEGGVLAYQAHFEELRSIMVTLNSHLSEAYFVSSFLSGLNEELQPIVKMLRLEIVEEAARMQGCKRSW